MPRAEISQGSLLRVVFCYATVRLFIAKREAAASPMRLKTKANAEPTLFVTPPPRARVQGGGCSRRRSIYCGSSRSRTCAAVQRLRSRGYELIGASSRRSGCQQTWPWTSPTVQRGLETQENSSREYCKTCKDRESAAANVKRASASANHQQPRGRAKNAANGAKDGIMASSCSSAAARKMAWTRRTRRS